MKRPVLLTLAIIFSAAALVVLVMLVASLAGKINIGGFFMSGFSNLTAGEIIKEEQYDISALNDLNISTSDQKIEIHLTDDKFLTVRQYDNIDAKPFNAIESPGKLTIEIGMDIRIMIMNFVSSRLEIYIPRSYEGIFSASSTSGSIVSDEMIKLGAVSLASTSGSIRLESGVNCASLSSSSTSGSIKINEITSAGKVTLESSSGSIRIEEGVDCADFRAKATSGGITLGRVAASRNIDISSSSGAIRTGYLTCASYKLKSTSGGIKTDGITGMGTVNSSSGTVRCEELCVTGDTQIQCSSGSVHVTMSDVKNLNFEISTSSGSKRTNGYNFLYDPSGNRGHCTIGDGSVGTLSIKTSSGSISIN